MLDRLKEHLEHADFAPVQFAHGCNQSDERIDTMLGLERQHEFVRQTELDNEGGSPCLVPCLRDEAPCLNERQFRKKGGKLPMQGGRVMVTGSELYRNA